MGFWPWWRERCAAKHKGIDINLSSLLTLLGDNHMGGQWNFSNFSRQTVLKENLKGDHCNLPLRIRNWRYKFLELILKTKKKCIAHLNHTRFIYIIKRLFYLFSINFRLVVSILSNIVLKLSLVWLSCLTTRKSGPSLTTLAWKSFCSGLTSPSPHHLHVHPCCICGEC